MLRTCILLIVFSVLAACTPAPIATTPVPLTPAADVAGAAVVRRAVPEPTIAPVPPTVPPTPVAIVIPSGAIYVCVTEKDSVRQTTAIEFAPKVGDLCTRNPEMGPCQYERNVCRGSGGRVYAANGTEITMQTEAEYDKKVMRVRLKSN
jgi:hypothetical protein